MADLLKQLSEDMENIVLEWLATDYLEKGDIFIVGCSTSEVSGQHIGTAGSEEVAEVIFDSLGKLQQEKGVELAFQCCEHLNRAIVLEESVRKSLQLDEVNAVPHPKAGGSMASYAYKHFKEAVLVEEIVADAGIDIGNTMIGMHLRKVAVPLRFIQKSAGNAHITGARTRPKLIGGERARYK